jgi:hypothetical protein
MFFESLTFIILLLFSIEGNQLETREEHKYWLTRHLEMCRQIILRDFRIITVTNNSMKNVKNNQIFLLENLSSLFSNTI